MVTRVSSNISDLKRCLFSVIISDLHGCFFSFHVSFHFKCVCSVLVCTLTTENVGLNDSNRSGHSDSVFHNIASVEMF